MIKGNDLIELKEFLEAIKYGEYIYEKYSPKILDEIVHKLDKLLDKESEEFAREQISLAINNTNAVKKTSYSNLQKQWPNHLLIRKEGCFYSVKNKGAEVFNALFGFKIGKNEKFKYSITGTPYIEPVIERLNEEEISYILVEDDMVAEIKTFNDNAKYVF